MFFARLTIAIALSASPAIAAVPERGACQYVESEELYPGDLQIDWTWDEATSSGSATVTSSGVVRDGIAVSFRTHNSGFKGNIRYVDDILGLSEVVVFQIETATRMGRVTFKEAAGEDWVDAIFPFEEAFCIVR